MKKLLYLFLAITIISCSKDDSSEPQTFFEKYDGVVWQKNDSDPDYTYRLQFNNATQPSVTSYDGSFGGAVCVSSLIEDGNNELTEINEDGFIILGEFIEDSIVYSYSATIEVSENGNQLTITYSDDLDFPETYNRTILNDPCQ